MQPLRYFPMHMVKYWRYILCDVKPHLRTFDDIDKPIRPEQVLPLPLRTKRERHLTASFFCLPYKSYPTFLKSGIFSVIAQHAWEAFHERVAAEYFLRIPGFGGVPTSGLWQWIATNIACRN